MTYITPIILLVILFYYINKKTDNQIVGTNRKRRFSLLATTLLQFLILGIGGYLLIRLIKIVYDIGTNITIIIIMLFVGLNLIGFILNRLYIHKNKDKDIAYRKKHIKPWRHYILSYPARTLEVMLELPPTNRFGRIDVNVYRQFHRRKLKYRPPIHIELLMMGILISVSALIHYLLNLLTGNFKFIELSIYPMVYLVSLLSLGNLLFAVFRTIERFKAQNYDEIKLFMMVITSHFLIYTAICFLT